MALCPMKCATTPIFTRVFVRGVATSACLHKVFRHFPYFGRGPKAFHERQKKKPLPQIRVWQYGREPGYRNKNYELTVVPEMIPELIVPDLSDFTLKPYVSYRAADVKEGPLTAKDLFYFVYSQKIRDDFQKGLLDENGQPVEPSPEEQLTAEEALTRAQKIGADMFTNTEEILNDDEWMKKQLKMEYN